MKNTFASFAFATLGHPGRLAVFRLIMRFAPQGVRPTEIANALALKQNTLSHHLSDLVAAGLIRVSRHGRSLYYTADLEASKDLIGYLALDLGRARPDLLAPLHQTHSVPDARGSLSVLFLCSGNSARSIMAEALLRDCGGGRFQAHSAGTAPAAALHPLAVDILRRSEHAVDSLHPKPIDRYLVADAPKIDFVFTVCDRAAAEDCPRWPGQPIAAHWGLPDPALATGTDAERALAFAQTYAALRRRIETFIALPFATLSRLSLQSRLDEIGLDTPS